MAVSTTSMSMIRKTEEKILEWVACIWYFITFKDQTDALLNLESKVNLISQAFVYQLGLNIRMTNVKAQKIDGTTLETYEMVVFTFFVSDKDSREKFFGGSFLLADVKPDMVLGRLFLIISNVDIDFHAQDLQ